MAVCGGLGPLAAGWLYDSLHHYELAFWLCAGAFLIAALSLIVTAQSQASHDSSVKVETQPEEEDAAYKEKPTDGCVLPGDHASPGEREKREP